MTTVYLVRHGESVANVERVFSNGRVDLPLTERGRAQARRLAEWLAAPPGDRSGARSTGAGAPGGTGRGLAHVYSAPLRRAQETAGIVAARLGLPCTVLADLDEVRVGDLDGRRDAAAWALHDEVIARWRAGDETAAFPGGETFRQAYERFAGALREIARRHPREAAVAVTHGAIQLTVVPRLCPPLAAGMASGAVPWTLPNTAIARLEVSADGEGFACTTWGASADAPAQ